MNSTRIQGETYFSLQD
jgi:hypothetical protein